LLPELLTLTIDDERIFFFTLTPSSFLLLPGLEKTSNTRRGQDLELESLKVANGLLERREERGKLSVCQLPP